MKSLDGAVKLMRDDTALAFAELKLDRLGERRHEPLATLRAGVGQEFELLLDRDGLVAIGEQGVLFAAEPALDSILLGRIEERMYYGRVVSQHPPGMRFVDLRQAVAELDPFTGGLAAYARALSFWQQRHRFCGACGAPTQTVHHGHRRKCSNFQCGIEHFPRTDPAIIVLVAHGDRCLLGRQAVWPAKRYSTLAGFVEPGETLEHAVRREVEEEAGVRVASVRYFASQPWPFPASLMVGFYADAADPHLDVGPELEDARWFQADALIEAIQTDAVRPPFPISISYALIRGWLQAQRGVDLADLVETSRARKSA